MVMVQLQDNNEMVNNQVSEEIKLRSTDYFVEMLKLIVTVALMFVAGLLSLYDKIDYANYISFYSYYASIIVYSLIFILIIWNFGYIVKITNDGNLDVVLYRSIVIALKVLAGLFFIALVATFFFISAIDNNDTTINKKQLYLNKSKMIIDNDYTRKVTIEKFENGNIKKITIN